MNTILSSQDWDKLQAVFDSAVDLDAEERSRYLEEACASDPRLRLRVESLLLSVREEGEFAQAVGLGVAATLHTPMHAAGDRLGSYQITGLIGHGGMGVVYRATRADDEYKKEVAIKVAASGFLTPEMRQRFLRERQILANLEHPNIARLLDGGTTPEGIPFVVMEFVEGKPLDAYCEQNRLDRRARIEAMIKVAQAVDYAHRHLVVHRDLKPDNILITAEGEPKLLDFGIAKALSSDEHELNSALTMDATRLLTPDYASPEQVRGEPVTTATDVYQLGILTYLLLTGRRPFQTRTANLGELQHAICEVPAPRPNLDADLDRVLLHALEKEPTRRYRSAEQLANDLQRYLDGYPVEARASSWVYLTRKLIARHRFASASVLLFVVTLAGVAAAMTVLARRASQQAAIATQTTRFLLGIFEANDPDGGRGDKITARELLDKSAAQLDRARDQDPVVQVQLLDSMGTIYNSLGASEKAKEMLERSLKVRLQLLKGSDIEVADTVARLADVETDLSHYDTAIALNQRALNTYRRRFGDNDERVAIRLARISSDYWEEDKLAQSEAYERDALKISTRLVSRADPRTLEMIGDLGTIVDLEGKPDEAERAYNEFLKGEQALNPPNLPNLGLAWNYKGWLHYRLGRFAEAEQEMRSALEMRIAAYGDAHPVTAGARASLAYILLCRQKAAEALALAQRAKADDEKTYGVTHRETSFAEDSLGLALLANGRTSDARTQFQAALKARQVLLPPNHMQVAKTWMFLGQTDYAAGNLALASEEARKSIALLEPVYGPHGHPQVAEFDALLLNVLAAERDFKGADEFGTQSIASFRKLLPPQNWRLAAIESALASSLVQDHQLSRAETLLRESLSIDEKSYGPHTAQTAQTAIRLAECLAAAGKSGEEGRLVRQYGPILAASPDGAYKPERDWVRRHRS